MLLAAVSVTARYRILLKDEKLNRVEAAFITVLELVHRIQSNDSVLALSPTQSSSSGPEEEGKEDLFKKELDRLAGGQTGNAPDPPGRCQRSRGPGSNEGSGCMGHHPAPRPYSHAALHSLRCGGPGQHRAALLGGEAAVH